MVDNRQRSERNTLNIKVFNNVTKTYWEHRGVPRNHVGMIDLNPDLEVQILRGKRRDNRRETDE
jgi:hypothetical protein